MLAIKECLIREGVLNLNNTSNTANNGSSDHYNYNAATKTTTKATTAAGGNSSHYKYIGTCGLPAIDVKLAMLRNQNSVAATQILDIENNSASSSNLSSASATAKTSCQQPSTQQQQQQPEPKQQPKQQQQQSKPVSKSGRYQGQHPHFHHHTAPVYYTDVHLRIHTPKAGDITALNEHYQSVYSTPSQLVNEHYFPKTSTATVVPPPIGPGTAAIVATPKTLPANAATATGGHVVGAYKTNLNYNNNNNSDSSNSINTGAPVNTTARSAFFRGGSVGNERKSLERYAKLSPTFVCPAKGDFSSYTPFDGSGSCSSNSRVNVQSLDDSQLKAVETTPECAAAASNRSRHQQRFTGRKRAVRVRSESRPISALYDIICKEKGLDIGTSSNDENSSAAHSHDDNDEPANAAPSHDNSISSGINNDSVKRASSFDSASASALTSAPLSVLSLQQPSVSNVMNSSFETSGSSAFGETIPVPRTTLLGTPGVAFERSKRPTHKQREKPREKPKKRKDVTKSGGIIIHSLSDKNGDEGSSSNDEDRSESPGGNSNDCPQTRRKYKLKSSRKTTNLVNLINKASSLPPFATAGGDETPCQSPNQNSPQPSETHSNPNTNTTTNTNTNTHASNLQQKSKSYHQYSPHTSPIQWPSSSPVYSSSRDLNLVARTLVHNPELVSNLNYANSPAKLFVEPVNMHLINIAPNSAAVSSLNSNIAGDAGSERRRKLREEKRRNTDGAASMIPVPTSPLQHKQHHMHSDDERVDEHRRATNARRFINRPSRTPSRGRASSANGSSPQRQHQQQRRSGSSSSPSPTHVKRSSTYSPARNANSHRSPRRSPQHAATNGNHAPQHDSDNNEHHHPSEQPPPPPAPAPAAATVMTNSAAAAAAPAAANSSSDSGVAATGQNATRTAAAGVHAVISDKKKDEELQQQQQQQRSSNSSPLSPRQHVLLHSPKQLMPPNSCSAMELQKSSCSSEQDAKPVETKTRASALPVRRLRQASSAELSTDKKLVPSVSVSMKQSLSELHFSGGVKPSKKTPSPKPRKLRPPSAECTVKLISVGGKLSTAEESDTQVPAKLEQIESAEPSRPRSSTMYAEQGRKSLKACVRDQKLELSPVLRSKTPERNAQQRDKSSKRKSNLNRALTEEATQDGDEAIALRRRRRRELGMARQLIPNDDPALRQLVSPQKMKAAITPYPSRTDASVPPTTELAYHMEAARRGWDLVNPNVSDRRRAQTVSPKFDAVQLKMEGKPRVSRRSDTLHLGELRKLRSNDVTRKLNERTKSDLADILKIAEMAISNDQAPESTEIPLVTLPSDDLSTNVVRHSPKKHETQRERSPAHAIHDLKKSLARFSVHDDLETSVEAATEATERCNSPIKHTTFVQEERIYYDPEPSEDQIELDEEQQYTQLSSNMLRQRVLKARSMERDAGHEPTKLSPILRRKSTDDPSVVAGTSSSPSMLAHCPIVSILKKKDHIAGESSSASSNASPVTFSANVVDTPTHKHKRVGILKKRSSLDESRYYSRSHSPDERSILIKSARRNSLEEMAGASQQQQQQHGILKQSSYESSKSDGCPSATEPHPHGILKKKDSTSTPSDGGTHAPKHVSISQAVILAAAELGRETDDVLHIMHDHDECGYTPSNEEYDIRPILKLESTSSDDAMRPPKPILKKKSSGDSDEHEIRPILKTSRKSSREEFEQSGVSADEMRYYSEPPSQPHMRPILKTESPSKRRSLGGEERECGGGSDCSLGIISSGSPGLLKRRTRSLERPEAPVDLAAALNAIATSQAAPVEFVSTPVTATSGISVAERIKSMEKFLSNNSSGTPSSPMDVANISWDSPLQSGAMSKILKPSAIKRDMYRERYKTQPVTSNEKNFFKATSSPFDTSAHSAFKPATKSLEALNYSSFTQLPTAAAASSATPTYTLARSSTQPLQLQKYSSATAFTGTPPLRAGGSNDNSISEQLTLSLGSDSERIFEMSGVDDSHNSSAGEAGGGVGLVRKNSVRARANMFQQLQEKTAAAAGANGREERTSPRRAPRQSSPAPALELGSASVPNTSTSSEELKTPQNDTSEEVEPTSLPVSERLRFFTSLSEAAANRSAASSYTRSPPQRHSSVERCGSSNSYSTTYSYGYHGHHTPRSSGGSIASTGTSSTSVTPIPMECCYSPGITETATNSLVDAQSHSDSIEIHEQPPASPPPPVPTVHESSAFIKLTKSASYSMVPPPRIVESTDAEASSALTPTARRIKLKTIGKLMLPQTFLNNDRNNNSSSSSNNFGSSNNINSDVNDSVNVDDAQSKPAVKKIGKIKSPFIENCLQMQQKHHQINSKCMKYDLKSTPHNALSSLENNDNDNGALMQRKLQNGNLLLPPQGSEDSNTDSGKENHYCEANAHNNDKNSNNSSLGAANATSSTTEHAASPIVEMRKKLTRILNNPTLSLPPASTAQRTPTNSGSLPATPRGSMIDDKYAKYFGITPSGNSNSKERAKEKSSSIVAATNHHVVKRSIQNMPDVCQVTPKVRCDELEDELMQQLEEMSTPPLAAINANVRLKSSTPYYTPPCTMTPSPTHTPPTSASNSTTNVGNPAQKRRDMAKRHRAMTTIVSTTPNSSQCSIDGANVGGASSTSRGCGAGRALRTRALTITHGVQLPEVQRFEDIVVTKEEFQLASKEFDRIFLGIA